MGVRVRRPAVEGSAITRIEEMVLGRDDAKEIFGVHGHAGDAIGKAVEVDLDVFLLFFRLFLFLLFLFLGFFLFVFLFLVGFLALVGAGFAFLGYGDFVAFRRGGGLGVLAQSECIYGVAAIGGVVLLRAAELRV